METKIVALTGNDNTNIYETAAEVLKQGGLVAFPTETVYGIGANALKPDVVRKIYAAKGRPSDNPLIVHIGHASEVAHYVASIPDIAYPLMEAFWPGPLTLIFEKNELIPDLITGGLSTVAIRVPSHPVARGIIEASGLPIAAPSANLSGKPSPTIASHVIEDLNGRVDMIVDGGDAQIGLESTVLDLTQPLPMILRPGGVTKTMLEAVIGEVAYDPHLLDSHAEEAPKAPGMKYRHYAPKGQLTVFKGRGQEVIEHINQKAEAAKQKGLSVGIIATKEDADQYKCGLVQVIGSANKPDEIAANLFKVLRTMDQLKVDVILTRDFSEEAIGTATMNRLLKAAGNRQIEVGD